MTERTTIKWEDLPPWRDIQGNDSSEHISHLVDRISRVKASHAEAQIYAALVAMGWTPPSDKREGEA